MVPGNKNVIFQTNTDQVLYCQVISCKLLLRSHVETSAGVSVKDAVRTLSLRDDAVPGAPDVVGGRGPPGPGVQPVPQPAARWVCDEAWSAVGTKALAGPILAWGSQRKL